MASTAKVAEDAKETQERLNRESTRMKNQLAISKMATRQKEQKKKALL